MKSVSALIRRSPHLLTFCKLSPLLIPFTVLFAGGLSLALAQSLGIGLPFAYDGEPLDAYRLLLQPHFIDSFILSFKVALLSALFSVAGGALLAVGLWSLPSAAQQLGVVYKIPLILPHIAIAFIVLVSWSQSGIVASGAYHLGLITEPDQFPALLYDGSGTGMVLAYIYKELPFVLLMAFASLKRLDHRLVDTARMLGAGNGMILRSIILPHISPVLHTTFIILFLYSFGAFEIPFLLGESRPGMLSIEAYNLYFRRELQDRPCAMAILVCMFTFSIAFIILYMRAVRRFGQQERKL